MLETDKAILSSNPTILDLIVLTTGLGLMFALAEHQFATGPDHFDPNPLFTVTDKVLFAIIHGIPLAGIVILGRRLARPGFLAEAGHWMLCFPALVSVFVIANIFTGDTTDLSVTISRFQWIACVSSMVSSVLMWFGCLFVSGWWRWVLALICLTTLGLSTVTLIQSLMVASFIEETSSYSIDWPWERIQLIFQVVGIAEIAAGCLLILASIVSFIRRSERHAWTHWLGVLAIVIYFVVHPVYTMVKSRFAIM